MCGRADNDLIFQRLSARPLKCQSKLHFKEGRNLIKLTPTHIRNRFYDTLAEMNQNRSLYVKQPEHRP